MKKKLLLKVIDNSIEDLQEVKHIRGSRSCDILVGNQCGCEKCPYYKLTAIHSICRIGKPHRAPKFIKLLQIAKLRVESCTQGWVFSNYRYTQGLLFVSSQTLDDHEKETTTRVNTQNDTKVC